MRLNELPVEEESSQPKTRTRKRTKKMKSNAKSCRVYLLATAMIASLAAASYGDDDCWATAGSAGTVDEADTDIVVFNQSNVSIRSDVGADTLNIRYNISGIDDSSGSGSGDDPGRIIMKVRYVDNGAFARVVIRLKRVNLNTGTISILRTFDSNLFAQSGSAQTQSVSTTCITDPFNFENNAYFLDAELIKSGDAGFPILHGVSVCEDSCN